MREHRLWLLDPIEPTVEKTLQNSLVKPLYFEDTTVSRVGHVKSAGRAMDECEGGLKFLMGYRIAL